MANNFFKWVKFKSKQEWMFNNYLNLYFYEQDLFLFFKHQKLLMFHYYYYQTRYFNYLTIMFAQEFMIFLSAPKHLNYCCVVDFVLLLKNFIQMKESFCFNSILYFSLLDCYFSNYYFQSFNLLEGNCFVKLQIQDQLVLSLG